MIIYREALPEEASTVASVFPRSRQHHLPYLPDLHSAAEDAAFFSDVVFVEFEVWVAAEENEIVGFCAFRRNWVEHLYLLPHVTGQGIGGGLLQRAKAHFDFLQLWVFQRNCRAISFYEHHGFTKVRETDGSACEEKVPDALYEWRDQESAARSSTRSA